MDIRAGGKPYDAAALAGAGKKANEPEQLKSRLFLSTACILWLVAVRHAGGVEALLPVGILAAVYYSGQAAAYFYMRRAAQSETRIYFLTTLDCVATGFGVWLDNFPFSPIFFGFLMVPMEATARFTNKFAAYAILLSTGVYSSFLALYLLTGRGEVGPAPQWPLEAGKIITLVFLPLFLRPLVDRKNRVEQEVLEIAERVRNHKMGDDLLIFDPPQDDTLRLLTDHLRLLSEQVKDKQEVISRRMTMLESLAEKSLKKLRNEVALSRSSDKLKTDFLNLLQHELRTPLHHIIGFSEILEKQNSGGEASARMVGIIRSRATELFDNLEKLTSLSTLMSEQRQLELNPVNIRDLVTEVVDEFTEKRNGKKVNIDCRIEAESANVLLDYDVLRGILLELLSNALKFSPPGGQVDLRVSHNDTSMIIIVADRGKGFGENGLLEEVAFDLFRQGDGGLSRKSEGLGVGLFLVKQLVTLHEGAIMVRNREEGGAVFTVTIQVSPLIIREKGSSEPHQDQ
ncbi:MAG: HAMP domain-containing histidine kinase [Nitrospinota bacterium]|nr:HAMP domain-containing histidine kinase [Nitrospinota bacterium]